MLQVTLLALRATSLNPPLTRATIPAFVLACAASSAYIFISWLDHERSIRPSLVLTIYLILSILTDIARSRTLWLMGVEYTIPILMTCATVNYAVLLVLECTDKRSILKPTYQGLSKEITSSPLSRATFFWLNSLLLKGYKRILTIWDLLPLDPALQSENLHRKLDKTWREGRSSPTFRFSPKSWIPVNIRVV